MISIDKLKKYLNNEYFLYAVIGIVIGYMTIVSFNLTIFLILGLVLLLIITNDPIKAVVFLIILTPFSGTVFFKQSIMDIPGAKPIQILAIVVLFIAMIHFKDSSKMPKSALIFIGAFLTLFSISIIRSLENIELIYLWEQDKLSPGKYLLSEFIKPLLYFTPFIVILKYANTITKIDYILRSLIRAVVLLSIVMLFLYFFESPSKTDVSVISDFYIKILSLHRNNLATFYILAFPILLANYFIKKNIYSIIYLMINLIAIGFLYSRGAYLTVLLTFIIYLLVSKRTKYLPLLILLGIVASSFLATSIIERATLGWQSGNVGEISSGRVYNIWLPIINEYLEKPLHLIFGDGRYAVRTLESAIKGWMLPVGHPHNMFIELIIDTGFIGFGIIISFYIFLMKMLFRSVKIDQNPQTKEFKIAIIVSIIAFLISGMTDRSFFPNLENCFLWTILAIGYKLTANQELQTQPTNRFHSNVIYF